jgi:putative transposase
MRGRKAQIDGLEQYCFDKLSKTEGNARERRRYLAFAHIQAGKSFTDAAAMVRVERRTLMNWVNNFRKDGIEGLQDKPGRGAKPYLSPEESEAFKLSVLELQATRKGGRIRGKDVLELMKSKFGIEPSKSTVYGTLKRVDLVWITGRSMHPEANVEAQEAFKKTLKKM